MSETILNFFLKYMDEKQEYFKEAITSEQRVLYMSTNFYRSLTVEGGHGAINYNVKNDVNQVIKAGKHFTS